MDILNEMYGESEKKLGLETTKKKSLVQENLNSSLIQKYKLLETKHKKLETNYNNAMINIHRLQVITKQLSEDLLAMRRDLDNKLDRDL